VSLWRLIVAWPSNAAEITTCTSFHCLRDGVNPSRTWGHNPYNSGSTLFEPYSNPFEQLATQASTRAWKTYWLNEWLLGSESLGPFEMSTINLFSQVPTYVPDRHRQAVVTLEVHNSGLDRLGTTHVLTLPFATFFWVAFRTLETTTFWAQIKAALSTRMHNHIGYTIKTQTILVQAD